MKQVSDIRVLKDPKFHTVTNYCDAEGNCTKCGGCCGDALPVSEEEIEEIKMFMVTHRINTECLRLYPFANKPTIDLTCPFSNSDNSCKIYPVRPEICRRFKCCLTSDQIFTTKDEMFNKCKVISMRNVFFPKEDK